MHFQVVEDALIKMQQYGIGCKEFTSVSVVPAHIHFEPKSEQKKPLAEFVSLKDVRAFKDLDSEELNGKMNAVQKFYSSVKSRLLVAEVLTRIESGSQFTFDYLLLTLLAATIAFYGLTENSTVVLVASMLVSPIMGPILAGIFGSVIHDKKIRNLGIKVEIFSLIACVLIGFTMSLAYSPFVRHYQLDRYPTQEMVGRGRVRNLIVGVLVAIPSGAGVALGVLGGNSGSLVGVAISASLLPPAINAGALWALSLLCIDNCHGSNKNDSLVMGWTFNESLANAEDKLYYFEPIYQTNPTWASQTFILGFNSLMLTMANILCIIVFGSVILKIKRVTPDKIPQEFPEFWKEDLDTHVEHYNKNTEDDLLDEARRVLGLEEATLDCLEGTFLQEVVDKAQQDSNLINILNRLPLPAPAPLTRVDTAPQDLSDWQQEPATKKPKGLKRTVSSASNSKVKRPVPAQLLQRHLSCYDLPPTPVNLAPLRPPGLAKRLSTINIRGMENKGFQNEDHE